MKEFIVQKQIAVQSSKQQVWRALTDPDLTQKYFFGCRVYSNWMVDGPITFKRRILWIFPVKLNGQILKIIRGTMLQYSLKNSRSASESLVTLLLADDTGKTIVSVTDDVGKEEGAEARYNRSVTGWDKILAGLKRVVENDADKN
jgi:uncharacterized protein YndB with AHSA1/START domain